MAGVKENAYALTGLDRVKAHIGIADSTHDHDTELDRLINEVSARIETYCHRHFRSRTWTHDGTTLPRLDSYGGNKLWLPESPVTGVTADSFKLYPTNEALTEGYDEDFLVDAMTGCIRLVGGQGFYNGEQLVTITYTAGYTAAAGTDADWLYSWDHNAADLELAAVKQIAWAFTQKDREKEGVASRSLEGSTVTYLTTPWLPEVKDILDTYARVT